jgi:hypothetical protein
MRIVHGSIFTARTPAAIAWQMLAGIDVGQRQAVVKERHLDLPVLQRARDALVVFRRQKIRHRRGGATIPAGLSSSAPAETRSASSSALGEP